MNSPCQHTITSTAVDDPVGDLGKRHRTAALGLCDQAIGLFLEYRDRHGYDEDAARAKAVAEVGEAPDVDVREIERERRAQPAPGQTEDYSSTDGEWPW